MNDPNHTADHDAPTVCIAHGRFIPCRSGGGHRYTSNPYWVKSVRDYQGSADERLTWEPAWATATAEKDARDALYRLFDQAFNTAGDEAGWLRAAADYHAERDALPRHLQPHATFGDDPSGWCGCAGCDPRPSCGCWSCTTEEDAQ